MAGIRRELVDLLTELRANGSTVAGYGAPAKGNTLLNYCGIGPDQVAFLADRNELKQGLVSPGARIPVVPPERVLETQPDYLLVLAWNFADEIMRAAGGVPASRRRVHRPDPAAAGDRAVGLVSTLRSVPVLVTGGTGFIGSHLVRRLLLEQAEVHVLSRPAPDTGRSGDGGHALDSVARGRGCDPPLPRRGAAAARLPPRR